MTASMDRNSRGEWIPAIPEPLWVGRGVRKARCKCGRTFKDGETYQGHYALVHVLDEERQEPDD